jgi:tetratricopeptide (TPR) repeat protein
MKKHLLLLGQQIKRAKQALDDEEFDLAINAFEEAISIAKNMSPTLNNIIGVAVGNIALAKGHQGKKNEALEYSLQIKEYFSIIPEKIEVYTTILHVLGMDFQKLGLFDCSVILLKITLNLARKIATESDPSLVSTVTRQLAFSYSEMNNLIVSAKLFRISADIEEQASIAIDLYKNAAYLYYKSSEREEALNILETAYEKAGIIGDTENQQEIAKFQVTISYEIMKRFTEIGLLTQALSYSEVCLQKCRFLGNNSWTIKILYEAALVLQADEKIWLRNKHLKEIIAYATANDTKLIKQKAILLLTVHFLETKNYGEAFLYMQQLPFDEIKQNFPDLAQKLVEISTILEKSQQREQIHANIYFSRKDLDLPVEDLLQESKEEEEAFSKPEKPSSLELEEFSTRIKENQKMRDLKPPSIESLQELFDTDQLDSDQEEVELFEFVETVATAEEKLIIEDDNLQLREIQNSQIFSAHQTHPTPSIVDNTNSDKLEQQPQVPIVESTVETHESVQYEVGRRLQKAGWSVQLNFSSNFQQGSEPDIVGEKGLIRKKKKLIFFAESVPDAEICSFLLQSNLEPGERIIFLHEGNPKNANVSLNVKIITRIDQLFQ